MAAGRAILVPAGALYGDRFSANAGSASSACRTSGSSPRARTKVFGVSFTLAFVAAYVFAMFLGPEPAPAFTIGIGALAGPCWVGASFGINDVFEQRSFGLWAINAGYHTLAFTLFGVVFGLWH